jgi:predicted CxxxxCH...CXXCH cytochrome family protein
MLARLPLAALAAALLLAVGCDRTRPIVGLAQQCDACHALPPATGAHERHIAGGSLGPPVTCATCHVVPTDTGHVDGVARVTFGPLATHGGATSPVWNGVRCAGTYCHGGTLRGGSNTAPAWTGGPSEAGCGSCHGIPPLPHPTSAACGSCHPGYTATTVNPVLHMNGALDGPPGHGPGWAAKEQHGYTANRNGDGLDSCRPCHGANLEGGSSAPSCSSCHDAVVQSWQTNCTFCHGTRIFSYTPASFLSAAPPVGSEGETATSTRAVGAHQRHLAALPAGAGVACSTCHLIPADLSHLDGNARVTFGPEASLGGVTTPVWNGVTCASTFCHGATLTLSGGTNKTPSWTGGSAEAACGTCHGAPPPTGAHLVHASPSSPASLVYGSLHVLEDVSPSGGASYDFGCGNCHPLDPAQHLAHVAPDSAGARVADVFLDPAGAPTTSLRGRNLRDARYDPATRTCSGVSCHSSGRDPSVIAATEYVTTPPWDGPAGALGCAGCHGNPPRYPSGGAGAPDANSHLVLADDGLESGHFQGLPGYWHKSKHGGNWSAGDDAAPITCQACHAETVDPAAAGPSGFYWLDTTGDYQLPGGDPARLTSTFYARLRCTACHDGTTVAAGSGKVLPLRHVNGRRDVTFDPRTAVSAISWLPAAPNTPTRPYWVTHAAITLPDPLAGGVLDGTTLSIRLDVARYDPATKTCSTVACHLAQTSVTWGAPHGWSACGQCHPF